jgi:hypothetical protein
VPTSMWPSGFYPLGGPEDERTVRPSDFAIGTWPVTNGLHSGQAGADSRG